MRVCIRLQLTGKRKAVQAMERERTSVEQRISKYLEPQKTKILSRKSVSVADIARASCVQVHRFRAAFLCDFAVVR